MRRRWQTSLRLMSVIIAPKHAIMIRSIRMRTILIVGGGFGGIKAAQELSKSSVPDTRIRLIDPKLYLEYHAAVYRLVTGRSPAEVCIPYADLLSGTSVEHVRDAVASIDLNAKIAIGSSGSRYAYDTLILAVGGETSYFGIEGVERHSYCLGSVEQAIALKNHVHAAFAAAKTLPRDKQASLLHFVVIGGGASGVEMAGALAVYAKRLSREHDIDPSRIKIDLVEALPRLLSTMPEKVSRKVEKRLRRLGVNLLLNQSVVKRGAEELFLKDTRINTKTVVWTAGVKASALLSTIEGMPLDKRGRVLVDATLRIPGRPDVFVIGDAAATTYAGMAQTALADAAYVSKAIRLERNGSSAPAYRQPAPAYAVPAGPGWAAVQYHGFLFFGRIGWMLRRAADFRAFLSLLPLPAALRAYRGGLTRMETCDICATASDL